MSSGRLGFALFIMLAVGIVHGKSVSAETISVTQQVQVRAVVAPTQYIIIDSKDRILEIGSNTNQAVTPMVYRDKIIANTQLPLSSEVYQQYKQLVSSSYHPGVLYRAGLLSSKGQLVAIKKLDLLSI